MHASLPQVGHSVGPFVVEKVEWIEELQAAWIEWRHTSSRATIVHLRNEDPEKLFCLSFQTLPHSDNGAAHILEHTVLCGSRKYPIKDPFFAMTRRSLNTFMNALTGSDFTCYPAATLNEKDFFNLLSVYLDAVFHPKLEEMSFLQEGHRLEFATSDDPKSPLTYKGIVFNEMKGALASADSRLWHTMMKHLVTDLPYRYNSGGEPEAIATLTYQQLLDFHETYYHPSRCLFYLYGNIPVETTLMYLHENALKGCVPEPSLPAIPRQHRFKEPKMVEAPYPCNDEGDPEDKHILSVGFLTAHVQEQEKVLTLCLLDLILMGNDAAPLKKELLSGGLCSSADAYLDTEMTEIPYAFIFKGVRKNNLEPLKMKLFETLKKIVEHGIEWKLIDSALHQLEFSRSEIGGDHYPFGLTLFMRAGLLLQHHCDPLMGVKVHRLLDDLIVLCKDPLYLPSIIQKYFLDNEHRVDLYLIPDSKLLEREEFEEAVRLETIKKSLTEKQKEKIVHRAEVLEEFQEKCERQDFDCLPAITLGDVAPGIPIIPLKLHKHPLLEIYHSECFSNHILYADLAMPMPQISQEEIPYLYLLLSIFAEVGYGKKDYEEVLEFIMAHTGGISASCQFYPNVAAHENLGPMIVLKGKSIKRKAGYLFQLFREMIEKPLNLDPKRLEELVLQIHTAIESKITKNSLRYAMLLAGAHFTQLGAILEYGGGLHYLHFIRSLKQNLHSKSAEVIQILSKLKDRIFQGGKPQLILSCDRQLYKLLEEEKFFGLDDLRGGNLPSWKEWPEKLPLHAQMRPIQAQVAYCTYTIPTITFIHPSSPALYIACQLIENLVLHPEIREKGGAYGSGISYHSSTGILHIYSYRDPHIVPTWDTFERAIHQIAAGKFKKHDLEEAKIGIVQGLDAPHPPSQKASTAYGLMKEGKNDSLRQMFRDEILSVEKAAIQHCLKEHLIPRLKEAIPLVFGAENLLVAAKEEMTKREKKIEIVPI